MKFNYFWFLVIIATAMVACGHVVPFLDTVPLISQLKTGFQLATGDTKGAAETLEHYVNEGIGPAQARSAYFLVTGNPKKAMDIQNKFLRNMEVLVDGAPVIGHIKGMIHLITGDKEHGWNTIKSATSTTGSAIGGILGGPVGVVVGHLITDATISGVDAAINGNNSQPFGLVEYVSHFDELSAGDHFDSIAGLVIDGTTGKFAKNKRTESKPKASVNDNIEMLHERFKESEIEDPSQHERIKEFEVEISSQYNRVKESEIKDLPHHKRVKEFEIEGSPQQKRVTESEIESLPQHETPPMSVTRVSRPTIDMQLERRSMLELTSLTPDEVRNNIAFLKYAQFIRENAVYKHYQLSNLLLSDITTKTFNGIELLRHMDNLMHIDINTVKRNFDYLTDAQKSLITIDDFRTVNTVPGGIRNCLGCSVAGILKMDVETLQSRLSDTGIGAYDLNKASKLKAFLETCRDKNLLNFEVSPKLYGLENMNGYLKENWRHFENKQLILAECTDIKKGHAVVMRYKMVEDQPVTVLVDYQIPGFLDVNLPNPYRISPFIDTTHYKSFFVIKISEP